MEGEEGEAEIVDFKKKKRRQSTMGFTQHPDLSAWVVVCMFKGGPETETHRRGGGGNDGEREACVSCTSMKGDDGDQARQAVRCT